MSNMRRHAGGFGGILLVAAVAVVVTGVDIYFSLHVGLLAYPPYYDGISYMLRAKSLFYRLNQYRLDPGLLMFDPASVGRELDLNPISLLWQALIWLSFLLFGEGEWQAYTARFWPILLLLLLVLWVVKRRSGGQVMCIALAFAALLPTLSVGLRASLLQYLSGLPAGVVANPTLQWYLADLRPDLLFSVLMLWAVVPLIESVRMLDRRIWLVSGSAAGFAILAKSSTFVMLLFAWFLTIAYVFLENRHRLSATILTSLWSLGPFAILVTPWVLSGAGGRALAYFFVNWSNPLWWSSSSPTLLSEASYYWKLFPVHLGCVESWGILAVALGLSLTMMRKRARDPDTRMIAYLGLSGALYGVVSAAPNKNYFLGLPFYLLLWVFSWATLAPSIKRWTHGKRVRSWLLLIVVGTYVGLNVVGGSYGLYHYPAGALLVLDENRQTVHEIAVDMRSHLTNDDRFMYAPAYGFPGTLQYYMMDGEGHYPQLLWIDKQKSPEQFIRESVTTCKAVLAYEQDIDTVGEVMSFSPIDEPYFRAISEWVKRPDSGYVSVKTYHFVTGDGRLALDLYIRQSNSIALVHNGGVFLVTRLGNWSSCRGIRHDYDVGVIAAHSSHDNCSLGVNA
jgi:hypothetical protein